MTTVNIQSSSRIRRELILPYALWTAQALLALTFLFAGSSKLLMSSEDLTKDISLPVAFLRFIGVCEVFGAFGVTIVSMGIAPALLPLVVGLAAAFVAYARWPWLTE